MFKWLEGGALEITATFPAGKIGTTLQNLTAAAEGEKEEWVDVYPSCAKIADEEGFAEIAEMYRAIAIAEKYHEERYGKLALHLARGTMFASNEPVLWQCGNCGYVSTGLEALAQCPACLHPKGYALRLGESF